MADLTLLITGGAGFIGSAFVRRMFREHPDYHLLVLDALTYAGNPENLPGDVRNDNRLEFWYGNICNGQLVDALMARADAVVHFAAETHVSRSIFGDRIFFETDVLGTQTLANAALKHGVRRFVHISTSEVYGHVQGERMREDHPLEPPSPYAAAKVGADRLISSYAICYDFPAVIVRPFNNYGPHQHLEKVVPRFITSALDDEPLTVHGDGSALRDWIYVDDTCAAVDLVLHAPLDKVRGEVFNVSASEAVSVMDIAQRVLKLTGKPESLLTTIPDRPGQISHIADATKISKTLGFSPTVTFDDGLQRTVDWYAANEAWYRPSMWMRHVRIRRPDGTETEY